MTSFSLTPSSELAMVSPWSWNPSTITVLGAVCTIFLILIYHRTISLCLLEVFRTLWRRVLIVMNRRGSPVDSCGHGGLSSTILEKLPAIQFKKTDIECGKADGGCAICLGEFMEGEWLRSLPKCSHVFHTSCIDAWFRSHSSCPLCRTVIAYNSNCHPSKSMPTLLETLVREGVHGERGSSYHLHFPIPVLSSSNSASSQRTGAVDRGAGNTESSCDPPSTNLFVHDQHVPGQS
ncbi:RING-H2 finger protein [Nymphaea thermarum]|nr:RING-H2 finger protein [Nymphaea thermarum]